MGKVLQISVDRLSTPKNGVAVVQQTVAKVGTKKSGSAGNENVHAQIALLQNSCERECDCECAVWVRADQSHYTSQCLYALRGLPFLRMIRGRSATLT